MKTLWLHENCSRSWTAKVVSSMANKADVGTKVFLVARLSALRAACGIVVLGEPTCEPIDERNRRLNDVRFGDCLTNSL